MSPCNTTLPLLTEPDGGLLELPFVVVVKYSLLMASAVESVACLHKPMPSHFPTSHWLDRHLIQKTTTDPRIAALVGNDEWAKKLSQTCYMLMNFSPR